MNMLAVDAFGYGAMGVSLILFILLLCLAFWAFAIWMQWRVLEKAGFSGALALLLLGVGHFIIQIIMAFSRWPIEDQMEALRAGAAPRPPGGPPMTTSV